MIINKQILKCVLLISLLHIKSSCGAKILGFFSTSSRSHFILQEPIMRELAKRGHEVTVVSGFRQMGEPLKNYRYIEIAEANDIFLTNFASDALRSADKSASLFKTFNIMKNLVGNSLNYLRHSKFLPLKNENFDLLIVGWFMNEYALGLSGHFHCPSIVITANINIYPIRKLSGNPSSVSTIPSTFFAVSEISSAMVFFDRMSNFLAYMAEYILFEIVFYFYVIPFYNEEFPHAKYPSYDEVVKNLSLVLLTQHFSGHISEPLLPGVIEVEGMHIKREPSPLPTDIKQFLDSATDGAIFFSLGSNVKSSDLSQAIVKHFLDKFRNIKQKVLWKFETELPNLPTKVMLGKWLPQDDILAHPNVKLFISHCGKGGITEAKYHGVPILGVPIFGDQFSNAAKILDEGWAVMLPLADINAKTFSNTLDEVLNNSTYTDVAKKLSNLNRDRPEHPLDKAAFWIEYVIRHNGAKHLQSPAIHLNLLQYYLLDVFAFIIFVCFVIAKIIRTLCSVFLAKVFGMKKYKNKKQ